MTQARDVADLMAELETLRLADVEARRQYAVAQRRIREIAEYTDTLLIGIAGRRNRADELLDELLAMRAAEVPHAV